MTDSQKRGLLIGVVVVAGVAAAYSFYSSGILGPKLEVVGTLPQASKQQEKEAADRAAANSAPAPPANDAVRTGMDPADMEGNPKG